MSPKTRSVYRCAECGAEHPKWAGRCEDCGQWNALVEEAAGRPGGQAVGRSGAVASSEPVRLSDVAPERLTRWKTDLDEFDFVLGGGVVPGSLVLVGGEPGIGSQPGINSQPGTGGETGIGGGN